MKRVLSGVQPTGDVTIGNYLGAIKRFVELQETTKAFFMIVNLHAWTVPQDPVVLREKTISLAALYMAVGLDPNKATIFAQADVPEHTELAWLLQCIAYFGELGRMIQFKEKSEGKQNVTVGLYTYPVLQAADILIYQADQVPVGEDQKQHLELTRDLAERFNSRFGHTFTVPEPLISEFGARIMGLDDPTKKMSKSAPSPFNRITLTDSPDEIKTKIMKAVTDTENEIRYDPETKPGISNLLTIHSLFSGLAVEELVERFRGQGYGTLKKDLVEVVVSHLQPIQERHRQLLVSGEVLDVLKRGAERARAEASKTLYAVKEKMGLVLR
ncbi:tryptophan--tRNA ligase [Effusibacillus lacus]|uniref:Tryptophan--tRNA ligase n=1 Tax=Effusibacillus lacus TaxID=1348429 RepID=A0A292YRP1_9BACL|nr:tryptophan--tRNA ligase [Effusibacillus lacus]TCS74908.1 tryptophanyl-tRNA synthetase [Effusibacillus lacus]GAX91581.1 tryptophan--tRNA ligase [Effusibacillus lacus]